MKNKPSYAELEEIVQNQNRFIDNLIEDKKFWRSSYFDLQKEAKWFKDKYFGGPSRNVKQPATHLKLVHST